MHCLLVLLGIVGPAVCEFRFLLLHNNDMHAHFRQSDAYAGICGNDTSTACYGGFARIHSEVVRQKAQAAAVGIPTIFLNAGDSFQGTPYYTFFKWPIVAQFVDMLDLDVMSLGNHEFDDGIDGLVPYIRNVSVPIVSCNLNTSLEPTMDQPNLTPSVILTVNDRKIGIIGYITPQTKDLSNIGNLIINDEIPSIRAEAQKLLQQNVSMLIALGHSGYTVDQQIALEVEEIDVVVGGHSHTFLFTGTPPDVDKPLGPYPTVVTQPSGKQVPVVQAFWATKYLGYLELTFDDLGNLTSFSGSPILLDGFMPQDPDILAALKPYEENTTETVNKILGYTDVLLNNNDMACKLGECNIGNLISDASVDYVTKNFKAAHGWTIAAVALNQAGGIRASINAQTNVYHNGSITLGDVMTAIPWGAKVVVVNVTGEVLHQILEHSVFEYEDTITGHVSEFLQVSGLKVVYDMTKESFNRVVSVEVLCASCETPAYEPLERNKTYGVVIPEYLATGGDGFSMFKNITNHIELEDVDYMVVAKYIMIHSPVNPKIEGRITILPSGTKSSAVTLATSWTIMLSVFVCILTLIML